MNMSVWLAVAIVWVWCKKEFEICEKKLICHRCFLGEEIINFSEINVNNSSYVFIIPKRSNDFSDEVLYLQLNNGKQYKYKFVGLLWSGNTDLFFDTLCFKLKIKRELLYK
jgi:hypothetical protein